MTAPSEPGTPQTPAAPPPAPNAATPQQPAAPAPQTQEPVQSAELQTQEDPDLRSMIDAAAKRWEAPLEEQAPVAPAAAPTEPAAPAPTQEAQPATGEQPTEPGADGKPKLLYDADADGKLLDGKPLKPMSKRERLLAQQAERPLQEQMTQLQQQLSQSQMWFQQQLASRDQEIQQWRSGDHPAFQEANLAHLKARGAKLGNQDPEFIAVKRELEQFRQQQTQAQQQARLQQQRAEAIQREDQEISEWEEEIKNSDYEDLPRYANAVGFARRVYELNRDNRDPAVDSDAIYRQALKEYRELADGLIPIVYPHLADQLKPGQPGASAAAPQTPQAGATTQAPPTQPGAPAERQQTTTLPQSGSSDAGHVAPDPLDVEAFRRQLLAGLPREFSGGE